ncbi:MAG: pilus assembly protein PilM [Phycisphaerae bacterium]|nr:pilus assembly protein PilM [Phycisphaerae bacterium]
MASTNAVWGIDIGQCALKAIKLRPAEEGKVEAVAFDVIEHPKILSQPDADRDELISSALEKFASRNDWQGDKFVVGVPGQQTFARFCKMPPIDIKKDAKKIPELVRYEAGQQIPFDMDDVVWDYQVFTNEESPDIEVGIFAIRKDLIRKHLGYFGAAGIAPLGVQAIPAALYNFCSFDLEPAGAGGATVIVDVGAQNTDLIIVEPNSAWTRNIPLGGNSFTEALVRAFKLSFAKAENLKRSAADSKYARQIFQAMRPVFADLVAEIQRSLGFYSSTRREIELRKVVALGNAFRLPGLQKYLENNLTVAGGVIKLEKLRQIVPSATINAPQFTENILSFGAAYGLALQGLGLARIHATLLPPEMARIAVWRKKRPYFVATAASLLLAAAVPWVANGLAGQALESESAKAARARTQRIIAAAQRDQADFMEASKDTKGREANIAALLNLQDRKTVLPHLLTLVHDSMPPINPSELANLDSGTELREKIAGNPERFKRTERGQLIVESFSIEYLSNVDSVQLTPGAGASGSTSEADDLMGGPPPGAQPIMRRGRPGGPPPPKPRGGERGGRKAAGKTAGFIVRIEGRLLYGTMRSQASGWLENEYFRNLREQSRRPGLGFYIPDDDPKDRGKRAIGEALIRPVHQGAGSYSPRRPGGAGDSKTTEFRDPVTGEDEKFDWTVDFAFKVYLGEPPAPAEADEQP